jgi:hypothetical protein
MAVLLGVCPFILFDIMNGSMSNLVEMMQLGYESGAALN